MSDELADLEAGGSVAGEWLRSGAAEVGDDRDGEDAGGEAEALRAENARLRAQLAASASSAPAAPAGPDPAVAKREQELLDRAVEAQKRNDHQAAQTAVWELNEFRAAALRPGPALSEDAARQRYKEILGRQLEAAEQRDQAAMDRAVLEMRNLEADLGYV